MAQDPISPLDFGPTVWLDAADETTLTTTNDFVINWADKSGNSMDANAALVQVFNALGHSVVEISNCDLQQPISLSNLPIGLYLCQLTFGEEVYKRKFLKQ